MFKRLVKLPKNKSFFLFGPRQTGKSTLLRSLFSVENTLTFDLLKSEEYFRLSSQPELFREEVIHRHKKITHVLIDEVQRIPNLLNEVHFLLENKNAPCFILTGSSARKLKRSDANLLAGRALSFSLFPLSFEELGSHFSLHKALERGTLPAIYLEEDTHLAEEQLRAYVDTYLKEEIEREAQVRNIGQFVRFITLAGHENGNVLNFSNLSRETGTSYHTVKSYFQILEDTLLGKLLQPFAKSQRKRLSKHPKFYFFDLGVVRALQKKLSAPLTQKTPDYGKSFEHFLLLEIFKKADYSRSDFEFSFYRTERGAEVDLIIEKPSGEMIALEIKATDNVHSSDLSGLISFSEICPKAKLICACIASHRRKLGKVEILPWQEAFAEIFG